MKVHFIGIGGAGMSGIARIMLALGHEVSGSDIKPSPLTRAMELQGARIFIGHNASNLQGADLAVYSSAIPSDNPERVEAKACGIPLLVRAGLLAQLMREKKAIVVSGSHGKTTTTALIARVLLQAKIDPTIVVGAEARGFGGGARLGRSEYFVAEADESDKSFLLYQPTYSVITNIDRDHMDNYQDLDEIMNAFSAFANRTKRTGEVFLSHDDANIKKILHRIERNITTFGLSKKATEKNNRSHFLYADAVSMDAPGVEFDCIYQGRRLGRVELPVPGEHSVLNALPAIAIGIKLGIAFPVIQEALASYEGVERRFQIKGDINKITVIDDYAHHPKEIEATLNSLKSWQRRVICVFQPHRYTRTKHLGHDFGPCFLPSGQLIITDIYSAGEEAIPGVSARDIYENTLQAGHKHALFLPKPQILEHLLKIVKPRDVVIIMGAGDITEITDEFVERLNKR